MNGKVLATGYIRKHSSITKMRGKEDAYHAIEQLATRFGEQMDNYKKTDYNETLVRRDFIDPFLKHTVEVL